MTLTRLLIVAVVLACSLAAAAQGRKPPAPQPKPDEPIVITIKDGAATSELLPIVFSTNAKLAGSEFGAMYFGPKADSDISIIFILRGTEGRYLDGDFGIKFLVDGKRINPGFLRNVDSVRKIDEGELLNAFLKEEELTLMAKATKVSLTIVDIELERDFDTFEFTPEALGLLKRFAASVELIRSNAN